ncbi:serine/threonine protein kinase [Salmonella enterica subsp. enterica serovar Muenchen]|nr:serine/threonine protein kinase [Salmonella enterica subsp. enterica serovar Muenchen]ECZ5457891.1 serine/threonine protein kinase [Salmonella enterica subsp. enterica serovar Muenchen]EDG8466771.1 serine/threonine protein kinase [Salmonella enterica subsp. enterica serovar Muenchen]EDQ9741365.1 serine/threonine protein kinase [Salmonella enterica subsp. enterica serovar Oranienburg]EEN7399046.1 serine/threonine protein kinase [Salmonella enterica subsp. enterica serovar Muenchen]
MHVAHPSSSQFTFLLVRSCLSWHYPISPKNRKTARRPCPVWLRSGSAAKKDPLLIWFYPQ